LRRFQFVFGLVWAIDATLKWLPGFRSSFGPSLTQAGKGQPGWLHGWFSLWSGLPNWQTTVLAYGTAATETLLAVGLLAGVRRRSFYLFGAVYSLLIWAVPEGFGGPYHAGSTDIGTGIVYAFVFSAVFLGQPVTAKARSVGVDRVEATVEDRTLVPAS
jgi:hypothetical protein